MSQVPDFSTRPDATPRGRRLQTPALLASLLLMAASLLGAVAAARERRAAEQAVSALRGDVRSARERVESLSARGRGSSDVLSSQLVWTAEAPPGRLLAELSALLPPDVRLESVAFTYGTTLEVDAELVARRPASYDLFLERLSASPLFAGVLPGAEVREGEMRASVRMSYGRLP